MTRYISTPQSSSCQSHVDLDLSIVLAAAIIRPLLVQDPRAARPYLFSDGQNMYNRVVLVCTVNVYIPASLGRWPILRYLQNCTHFTYSLRTDPYVSCWEYCKQFEINSVPNIP